MKITTLTEKQFDDFAFSHPYRSYYQTSKYGQVMKKNGFGTHYLGFENKAGQIIGASLILYRDLFAGFKYAYAPRGFLLDYNNSDTIISITKQIQRLLFKQKYVFIKIDPLILVSKRNELGHTTNVNENTNNILNSLVKARYRHNGFNKYFENTKPRWQAILTMTPNSRNIFDNVDEETKTKIEIAWQLGLDVIEATTKDEIELFYNLVKHNDGKSLQYYLDFKNVYQDEFQIYILKADFSKIVVKMRTLYEKEEEYNSILTNKVHEMSAKNEDVNDLISEKMISDQSINDYKNSMVEATSLLKKYEDGFIVGGIAIIRFDGEIYTLIEGHDKTTKQYYSDYFLKWFVINRFAKEGYVKYNLNAITGDFTPENKYKELNDTKLSFNAEAVEYIGEFNYIINPLLYFIYKIPFIKKIINQKAK